MLRRWLSSTTFPMYGKGVWPIFFYIVWQYWKLPVFPSRVASPLSMFLAWVRHVVNWCSEKFVFPWLLISVAVMDRKGPVQSHQSHTCISLPVVLPSKTSNSLKGSVISLSFSLVHWSPFTMDIGKDNSGHCSAYWLAVVFTCLYPRETKPACFLFYMRLTE